jgi:protein-S-isoprenylcysteine O-methyltransferase Ste14
VRGRLFVAGQGVLMAALVLAPRWSGQWADEWPLPDWARWLGWALAAVGAVVSLAAFPQLGRALTPMPEPRPDAELTTTGLYRWVRHPIYSGVLAMGWGWTLAHPSWVTAALAAALTGLFTAKAGYEEGLLRERFADYADYAARTPRFVPRPSRSS